MECTVNPFFWGLHFARLEVKRAERDKHPPGVGVGAVHTVVVASTACEKRNQLRLPYTALP